MKTLILFFTLFAFYVIPAISQNIAITDDDGYTADPSAMLDVNSNSKGFLMPRLTTLQRNNLINPATGLMVFDKDEKVFYYYDGTQWVDVSSGNDPEPWSLNGERVYLADSLNRVGIGLSTPSNKLTVKGDTTTGVNESIFAVVNSYGDTLLAVYPEGTRVFVYDDPAKASGNRGGFTVGGFSTIKGATNEYFRVTPDSVRVYVNDDPENKSTANRGGFTVGGFSTIKGTTNEYLRVTPDSVRVYIDENTTAKTPGARGGFAVGSFNETSSDQDSLLLFSDQNGLNVNYLTQEEIDAIVEPRISSIVFNTTDSCLQIFLGYWESIWCTPLGCIYPSITVQPENDSIGHGSDFNAQFTVSAEGSKVYYHWQLSLDGGNTWTMIEDGGSQPEFIGARTDTLQVIGPPDAENGYYFRCLISNACGSEFTNAIRIVRICAGEIMDDRDGEWYPIVQIGAQCWLGKNLNIGTMIMANDEGPLMEDNTTIEKFCYQNLPSNCDIYGGLYEWDELMQYNPSDEVDPGTTQGICLEGWHIPTSGEWTQLSDSLGGQYDAGGFLKEAGLDHWDSPNTGATNATGFTGLPGGYKSSFSASFFDLGTTGYFATSEEWMTSRMKDRMLFHDNDIIDTGTGKDKEAGISVRCVKN
jgi:uncharacterized protein (TIGR02145 family)